MCRELRNISFILSREYNRICINATRIDTAMCLFPFFFLASHFALLFVPHERSSHAPNGGTMFHRTNVPSSKRKTLSSATWIYWLERIGPFDASHAALMRGAREPFTEYSIANN